MTKIKTDQRIKGEDVMKTIKFKAEHELLTKIKDEWKNEFGQKCLYLRVSKLEAQATINVEDDVKDTLKQTWFNSVIKAADTVLNDQDAHVFWCDDGDIFIVSHFITQKNTKSFLAHLMIPSWLHSSEDKKLPEDVATLFEIKVDHQRLEHLCVQKQEAIKIKQQQVRHETTVERVENRREKFFNITPNEKFVATLSERRANREDVHVMAVEDDAFTQKLMRNVVPRGCKVTTAEDGTEALLSYVEKAPDIIFLDIGLPDVTGHDVLKRILDIDPDAFVVMLSGQGDKDNIMSAIENGAKGFIGKPFTKDKVLQYLETSPFIQQKDALNKNNNTEIVLS